MKTSAVIEQSLIVLYSGFMDPLSHRVRIIVQEKEAAYDLFLVNKDEPTEDFLALSPYQMLPVLVDRDLVLFDSVTIMQYLDERFPHPPLMPVDPAERARIRQMLMRIDHDWTDKLMKMQNTSVREEKRLAREIGDSLAILEPIFAQNEFFMYDEFTMLDCAIAPILWQLESLGIKLPKSASSVTEYADRLFARPTFKRSLTEYEEELKID